MVMRRSGMDHWSQVSEIEDMLNQCVIVDLLISSMLHLE